MPYDPNIPINGDIVDADELRGQFAALHEENAATNARIDGIPAGPTGEKGDKGDIGGPGPQGPPFASAVVDGVATLNPGDNATVSVSFDGTQVHFSFGLPRGADGSAGMNGSDGGQGPAGEVTTQQMNDAIGSAVTDTARNPGAVGTFGGTFSDPPTQGEMQAFAAYVEGLRVALQR